jgi:hypothetical protein
VSPSSPPQYLLLANIVVPSIASPVTSRETNVGIPVSSATESKLRPCLVPKKIAK